VTGWLGRRALRTIHEFRTRLARYHLQQRRTVKAALAADPVVESAILQHAQEHSLTHAEVRRRVERYVDEIVPQLNVLSYYKIGYNLAKIVLNLLYRVTVDHQDEAAL
jgi:glycerol-3-phosphate O-acyltransferase